MRASSSLLLSALAALTTASTAAAAAPQPPLDRAALKATYQPEGGFKPGDLIPLFTAIPAPDANGTFNPSGHWSAYDSNVYESLNFPQRQGGDESATDPPGNGGMPYGFCPVTPGYPIAGKCVNHQLEYLDYFEKTMKAILGDFGVVIHRYQFESAGAGLPRGGPFATAPGRSFNISATVPGADDPDASVLVSGHYDFTDSGPAAAWDSSEGHAEVIRMAAIMADYWRRTGTRPSATVKFIPWDAEESGAFGSADYVENNIPPGQEAKVRGYFNVDPCAGAYPAFYHGNPAYQVPQTLQLTDPSGAEDAERITAFNKLAIRIIDDFWADIDDTVDTAAGPMPVFTDADRSKIVLALGGLLLFSSDYANFAAVGVPIFNLFPDQFGPHADGTPASAEGAVTIHTPRDNLTTLNALTSVDQTGLMASDGWMTGMELCAQIEARGMLQPEMGGAQVVDPSPVAYFEALPNEAQVGKLVNFDAGGSYQYASLPTRTYIDDARLQYKWEFGDGVTAYGKKVGHAYRSRAVFPAKLTLTNRDTRQADTMTIPVTVGPGTGADNDPPGQDQDPGFPRSGTVAPCARSAAFTGVKVTPQGSGLRVDATTARDETVQVDILKASSGRRAIAPKKVAGFTVQGGSATYDGTGARAAGFYIVRVTARGTQSRPDVRQFAVQRRGGKFVAVRSFQRPDSCALLSVARLSSPAFDARRALGLAFTVTKRAKVTITVRRAGSSKTLRRIVRNVRAANRIVRVTLRGAKLRRGDYRITVSATRGKTRSKAIVYARRL